MLFNKEILPVFDYYPSGNVKTIQYFNAGELSRFDGPAFQSFTMGGILEREAWMHNGDYHRTDGPAWIHYKTNGAVRDQRFYLKGIQHSLDCFLRLITKEQIKTLSSKYYKKPTWRASMSQMKRKG